MGERKKPRLLVDTNVVIDWLQVRSPFDHEAKKLIALGYLGEFELWMSSSQITDAFYILSEGGSSQCVNEAKRQLKGARKVMRICALNEADVDAALDSAWDDFEDACVYQAALHVKADAIITRNGKDFAKSSIRVLDCEGFFAYLEEEKGVVYDEIAF